MISMCAYPHFHISCDLIYELNFRETGEWTPIEGTTYTAKNAKTHGDAYKQEAVSKARCLTPDVLQLTG